MMTRTFLTIVLCLGGIGLFAQQAENNESLLPASEVKSESDRLLPEASDWGVTVNMTGLLSSIQLVPRQDMLNTNALMVRYTRDAQWTYRFGVSPNIYSYNVLTTDSVGKDLVEFDSTVSQTTIAFRPGVEYHLEGTRRLDPYIALDGEFGVVGGMDIGSVTNITDTTGVSRITRTITQDGGFVVGAKLSAGMNYFLAKRFSLGLEYGLGVSNVVTGGDRQEVVQIEPVSGSNQTIRNLSSARTSTFTFLVDPRVQLTVSYFFGL